MSKIESHEIISAIKCLAIELGHTPGVHEFAKYSKISERYIYSAFGSWTVALQACGLDPVKVSKKKIDNSIFNTSIERHLESYTPKCIVTERKPYPKIASISDIHWPFHSKKVIDAFLAYIVVFQPEWIVLNGDAWDMYSHAKFPRSHNVFTPREERNLSRSSNEQFWLDVKQRCPQAKCVQMLGNHDVRPLKRMMEIYPSAEDWIKKAIHEEFTFDGVQTIFDPREELIIGNIAIFHGHRSQLGSHRDYTHMNCMNGHTHRGGAVFKQIRGEVIWELNSGLAGDPEAKGLTYTAQKITEWTQGFSSVDEYGPRFIAV